MVILNLIHVLSQALDVSISQYITGIWLILQLMIV